MDTVVRGFRARLAVRRDSATRIPARRDAERFTVRSAPAIRDLRDVGAIRDLGAIRDPVDTERFLIPSTPAIRRTSGRLAIRSDSRSGRPRRTTSRRRPRRRNSPAHPARAGSLLLKMPDPPACGDSRAAADAGRPPSAGPSPGGANPNRARCESRPGVAGLEKWRRVDSGGPRPSATSFTSQAWAGPWRRSSTAVSASASVCGARSPVGACNRAYFPPHQSKPCLAFRRQPRTEQTRTRSLRHSV